MKYDNLGMRRDFRRRHETVQESSRHTVHLKTFTPIIRKIFKIPLTELSGNIDLFRPIVAQHLYLLMPIFFQKMGMPSDFKTNDRGLTDQAIG
jgi:hypothetical protein